MEYVIKDTLVRELLTFLGKTRSTQARDARGEDTVKEIAKLMAKLGEGWHEDVEKYYELKEHKPKILWWR